MNYIAGTIILTATLPYVSLYLYRITCEEYTKYRASCIHNDMMSNETPIFVREDFYKKSIQDWKLTNEYPEKSICRTYDNQHRV
jgi:hypothetical protein